MEKKKKREREKKETGNFNSDGNFLATGGFNDCCLAPCETLHDQKNVQFGKRELKTAPRVSRFHVETNGWTIEFFFFLLSFLSSSFFSFFVTASREIKQNDILLIYLGEEREWILETDKYVRFLAGDVVTRQDNSRVDKLDSELNAFSSRVAISYGAL